MLQPSSEAYRLIKSFEGFRSRAYKALKTEKYFTIGYGHCSQYVRARDIVTTEDAEILLDQDVALFSSQLATDCPNLNQRQYDALVSLIYNIGWCRFRYSMTYVTCRNIGITTTDLDAARRIVLWVKSADKVILGLQKRRVIEANHFLGRDHFELVNGEIIG